MLQNSKEMYLTPIPKIAHAILGPSKVLARTIIVGDIHGCLLEFQDLLAKCCYDSEDTTVVLVGDLVNKGRYSVEMVKFARKINAQCVRGNHEESLLSYAYQLNPKPRPPSYDYIDNFDSEDLEWLRELPYTISIPSLDAIVVHAGLVPQAALSEQIPNNMHSMRNIVTFNDSVGQRLVGTTSNSEGVAWASLWQGPTHIYFGHDARRGLQQYKHCTGLDTGCVYGKKLTAVILPEREIVQVSAREVYAETVGPD